MAAVGTPSWRLCFILRLSKKFHGPILIRAFKGFCLGFLIIFSYNINCLAQTTPDTVSQKNWSERLNENRNYKKILGIISREPRPDQVDLNIKSEDPYLAYEGKIIRNINIEYLGFDKSVLDTAGTFKSFMANTANKVHTNTREFVIRNHLFVKEGKPLNPYRVADNERTIRNLDFIKDARIYVKEIPESPDSVDLLVITRDVFNLGGSVSASIPNRYRIKMRNINLAGTGQALLIGQAFDNNRRPRYGYDIFYRKTNILGSFIDASVGYSNLNRGISVGNENEYSISFKLSRELFQPFTRFAGAVEYSNNISRNVYEEPDSTFAQYQYKVQDYWLGYSFRFKNQPKNLKSNRNRTFIAIRNFRQDFLNSTHISNTYADRFAYRDMWAILGQLTFFRQDFYKTQYVLGFGRTEDIPYGYRVSFTAGWEKELENKRPYLGNEIYYSKIRHTGSIHTYKVKLASYLNHDRFEDMLFSFNFTRFGKIDPVGSMNLRSKFEIGYAVLYNQNVKRGIDIQDLNGIRGFKPDSLTGIQRITIGEEITAFTVWKVLGFRLAPSAGVNLALLQRTETLIRSKNFFTGFSLGLRAHNENLIFKTVEARIFYFPRTVEGIDNFRMKMTTNFRIKYPTNLVNKPSTVFR